MRFKNRQQRTAHRIHCLPTGGACVCTILPLRKTQGVDPVERWEETWHALFPHLRKPTSPWWSENILCEQITLSNLKRIWKASRNKMTNINMNDVLAVLSEWVTTPPDHLPNLQTFKSQIALRLANDSQPNSGHILSTPPPASYTSNVSEFIGTADQHGKQDFDITQAERGSNCPSVDMGTTTVNELSSPVPQASLSSIAISPHGPAAPFKDAHNTNVLYPDFSNVLEAEEPQACGSNSARTFSTNTLSPTDYFQINTTERDKLNSISGFGENNSQYSTAQDVIDTHWSDLELGPGFFDQAGDVDSGENMMMMEQTLI
ncbi:hypothetical protein F5B22DRAFT_490174 [Xylaria bambusicola]|uniref:uncharacterized protein n=1 Tax=Xylaria bambusicola TaxID=326684 RepID=UPI0020086F01|nr:uncharacterized protein F5B22DRAFT_490174 [Xylaria bambusicola]KAI0505880.1 hypothetical protein F5B22DRAFT_490174 [Xylaria bambusicola]